MAKKKADRPRQDYKYEVILYPDSESYDFSEVVEKLQAYFDMWAWILHDKDVSSSTGEPKKTHAHFVGRCQTPVPLQTIANASGVPGNDIQFVRSFRGAMRYLIHADSPEKYPYEVAGVVSNFRLSKVLQAPHGCYNGGRNYKIHHRQSGHKYHSVVTVVS